MPFTDQSLPDLIKNASKLITRQHYLTEYAAYNQLAILLPEFYQKTSLNTDRSSEDQINDLVDQVLDNFHKLNFNGHRYNNDVKTAMRAFYAINLTNMNQ